MLKKVNQLTFLIFFLILFTPNLDIYINLNFGKIQEFADNSIVEQNIINNELRTSDIAGSDLYAEKIQTFVAGNKSIIKQSLFTNDSSILSQFDSNDPAFYKCNVLLSVSNGKNPDIFPIILTESDIPSQYMVGYNSFVGFLYYDHDVDPSDALLRAERGFEIIKSKFMIDLIMVNVSETNFFPFVGYYPDWEHFFEELTRNFPMDGYWKALNIDRLISQEYLENYHLSATYMLINSLDFFEGDYNIELDQINFNIGSIDLSFFESLEIGNLANQSTIIDNFGGAFNATISEDGLDQLLELFSTFTLTNNSNYSTISVQYEGLSEGIQKIGSNQYKFSLWRALGYEGEPLAPSKKIYIALIGAFLSSIEINILASDIIDATPLNFEFYDYLLEQLSLLFFLAGSEFDVQQIEDYSFDLFWLSEEGIKRSYVKPVNLQDPTDVINLLPLLGFSGISYIPTGIVNPFNELTVTYNISNSESNILLKKELIGENASYGAFRNFKYNISAKNVGNITAWGVPTPVPLELDPFFQIISPFFWENLKNDMWDVINIIYPNQYDSLEDFFNFDEDPRIFYFDSLGTGIFDTFYPNLLNITNLWPYNEEFDVIIDIIYPENLGYFVFPQSTIEEFFMNENSIWNDANWRLGPGEVKSYQVENISLSNIDSFSPFYRNNFSIDTSPETPEVVFGASLEETNPEMALSNDTVSWIIGSVEKFLEQRIEINFIFKNDTQIDFTNNTLEKVSLIINFTAPDDLTTLNFEIFNFSIEEFQNMDPYLESITNNSWIFSFINNNNSLDWLFYPFDGENYTLLFKIKCVDSDRYNISINDLDIEFSARSVNINDDTGSRLVYGSSTGIVQFERRSNSIPLSTYNSASIITYSFLDKYTSDSGEIITYNIYFKNIGASIAENVSISVLIPGIIHNANNFTLHGNNLTYYLPKLAPSEEKIIYFTFYVPNSISIKEVSIVYYNPEVLEGGNSTKMFTLTNEVCIYTPVDYSYHFPFIRTIEIFHDNKTNFLNDAPIIGEIFNLSISLKNTSPNGFGIPELNISMNDQYGELKRINNLTIHIEDITFNETRSFNIAVKKLGWKGYYYPPINYVDGSESRTIQISNSLYKILGNINFSIIKSVNSNQLEIGDDLTINIELQNTGSIIIEDIVINDISSYSQTDFTLIHGNLVNIIDSLEPGEKVTVSYVIKAKNQGLIKLKPANVVYFYLLKNEIKTNIVNIKIITPLHRQLSYLYLPNIAVFLIFIVYIWQIKIYRRKRSEFDRSERFMFGLSSRETILKVEHTLRERLTILSKNLNREGSKDIKNKDGDSN